MTATISCGSPGIVRRVTASCTVCARPWCARRVCRVAVWPPCCTAVRCERNAARRETSTKSGNERPIRYPAGLPSIREVSALIRRTTPEASSTTTGMGKVRNTCRSSLSSRWDPLSRSPERLGALRSSRTEASSSSRAVSSSASAASSVDRGSAG